MTQIETRRLPKLLHERDAAVFLGMSIAWMQKSRYLGTGPKYVKVGGLNGRAVRYRYRDLVEYIEINLIETTSGRTQ